MAPAGRPALAPERALGNGALLNHIAGEWRDGSAGERTDNLDPATGEPLLEVVSSSADDATTALHAAADAQKAWARTTVFERAAIILRAAGLLRDRAERIAHVMTLEEGKPFAESCGEVLRTAEVFEVFAGLAYRPTGEMHAGHRVGAQWTFTLTAPLGVVVVISPWNFPLLLPAQKVVAALITGNTVVLKPADPTPLTAAALIETLEDAGLPTGAANLVIGRGSQLGPALLQPPANAVTLTGGNAAGQAVAQAAVEHHLKYQLELGGNNPALVLADADLDLAERELVAGAIGSTGQKCTATRRVFVEDAIFDRVSARLQAAFACKRLGPGIEGSTQIGPLVTAAARDEFESDVADAQAKGAELRRFGEVPERGFFGAPTLLLEPDPAADFVQRETFGPLTSLMRVSGYEDGVERCNETPFGLSASLFSSSMGNAIRFAEDIDAGMIHVNSQTTGAEPHMPFGGMKASSNYSRELGRWGVEWYTQLKAVYVE